MVTSFSYSKKILIISLLISGSVCAQKVKDWTFITYMSADNDLAHFSRKNLSQQADIGSNNHINIVTQLDTRVAGGNKVTKRYYVEKNKIIITNNNDPSSQKMNSGDPETLIDCCRWAITNYPARHYALIFWNHGTGIIDIGRPRTINPSELFTFNPDNSLIELDRSIPFLDFLAQQFEDQRGICFDDSTGQYLTNQNLEYALKTISTHCLGGKKFDIIGFDACLMSMVEVGNILKDYADIMVGSQEVELGTGWDYSRALEPFLHRSLTPVQFAQQIVEAYQDTYVRVTNDYTQSAIDLSKLPALEDNVNRVATLLLEALKTQKNGTARDAIKTSRHKLLCTHFDEPSYIDLHHFYSNLLSNSSKIETSKPSTTTQLKQELQKGLELIKKAAFANVVGKNVQHAKGISIYFPERRIHNSYRRTNFVAQNAWGQFLSYYIGK